MTVGSGEYQSLTKFLHGADHFSVEAFPRGPKLDTSIALLVLNKKDALLWTDFPLSPPFIKAYLTLIHHDGTVAWI